MDKTNLALILPCYNPKQGWLEHLFRNVKQLQEECQSIQLEVIVVNDGSSQGIDEEVKGQIDQSGLPIKWLSYEQNMGKGYAVRQGVMHSNAAYVVYSDYDFPYTITSMKQIISFLLEGKAEVIAGIKDKKYYDQVPWNRKVISLGLRNLTATILGLSINDTQCGLKGFNLKGKQEFLKTRINRYLFDLEFIYKVERQPSLKLYTHPVSLRDGVVFSQVNWRILFQEGLNFIRILFRK